MPADNKQFVKAIASLPPLIETLDGAYVLETGCPNIVGLDPGGSARNVTLPDVAACEGKAIEIVNMADGAETLTVKNAGGDTIQAIAQNKKVMFASDGTNWLSLGIVTIAFS